MEAIKIIEQAKDLRWDYDAEADVLYLSVGNPKAAVGIDVGEGTVLRYDEKKREVVGITFIGLKSRLLSGLKPKKLKNNSRIVKGKSKSLSQRRAVSKKRASV